MADWRGRGGGVPPSHTRRVEAEGGPGKGGGRAGAQPQISSPSNWTGKGGGRSKSQPTIQAGSQIGTRTTESTAATMTKGIEDQNVADPEGAYVFALEIDGIEVAQFLECSGLKTSTQVFELEEGGMNHRVHKLPGQSRWENITLRYGVTGDVSLLEWRNKILQDQFDSSSRKNGSIVVKNNQMEVVRRYHFQEAWPVAWEGPTFSASSSEIAIEVLELAHHGITVSS